jgi:hypothetical protein
LFVADFLLFIFQDILICMEWKRRGYVDNCLYQIDSFSQTFADSDKPWWLGDPRLHLSHQSNLLRKAPWAYAHLWPDVPRDLDYWWPSKENNNGSISQAVS